MAGSKKIQGAWGLPARPFLRNVKVPRRSGFATPVGCPAMLATLLVGLVHCHQGFVDGDLPGEQLLNRREVDESLRNGPLANIVLVASMLLFGCLLVLQIAESFG